MGRVEFEVNIRATTVKAGILVLDMRGIDPILDNDVLPLILRQNYKSSMEQGHPRCALESYQ